MTQGPPIPLEDRIDHVTGIPLDYFYCCCKRD